MGLGAATSSGPLYNDLYEYDPSNDTWTARANYPGVIRSSAVGFTIGSKGYVGLGNNNLINANYSDFYEFDPTTNSWTVKASFPGTARGGMGCFSIGNSGFVGCGHNFTSGTRYNDFWEYTLQNNTWTQRASFAGTQRSTTGLSIGNRGYFGTGDDGYLEMIFGNTHPSIMSLQLLPQQIILALIATMLVLV
ncbi:hypothetical protein BH11BAC1_BH11BAC1_24960 [soil metagenome]